MAGTKSELRESVIQAVGLFAGLVELGKENKQELMPITAGLLLEQLKANLDSKGKLSKEFLEQFDTQMVNLYPECGTYIYAFLKDRYGESSKRSKDLTTMTYNDFTTLINELPDVCAKLAKPGADIQEIYASHGYNLASTAYSYINDGLSAPKQRQVQKNEETIVQSPPPKRISVPVRSAIVEGNTWITSIFVRDKPMDVSIGDPEARIRDITRLEDGSLNILMKAGPTYVLGYGGDGRILMKKGDDLLADFAIKRNLFGVPKDIAVNVPFPADFPLVLEKVVVNGKALALTRAEQKALAVRPEKLYKEARVGTGEDAIIKGITWITSIFVRDKPIEVSVVDRNERIKDIGFTDNGSLKIMMKNGAVYALGYEKGSGGSFVLTNEAVTTRIGEFAIERSFFGVPKSLVAKIPLPVDFPFAIKTVKVDGTVIAMAPLDEHIAFRDRRKAAKV